MASARAQGGAIPTSHSYIGKGRGRGRGKLAPVQATGPGGGGQNQSPVGRVLHIIETADSSSISAESLAEQVSQEAESRITTGDEITKLAQSLYTWAVESPEHASCAAIACNAISKLERDTVKFRSPFLTALKTDFDTREEWRNSDENKWLSLACLLCQFFKIYRVNGEPFRALIEPSLTCLQILLASPNLKWHVYGVQQLMAVGPILYTIMQDDIDEIMNDLRRRLLASDTLSTSRILFLEALEFYAGGWQMDDSAKDYYTDKGDDK